VSSVRAGVVGVNGNTVRWEAFCVFLLRTYSIYVHHKSFGNLERISKHYVSLRNMQEVLNPHFWKQGV